MGRFLRLSLCGCVFAACTLAFSQQAATARDFASLMVDAGDSSSLPDAPEPQQTQVKDPNSKQAPANEGAPKRKQQPKRILGIMPNYRAVSAGAIPPPPTAKQAFKIATQNSFDYSSFVFVGLTSMIAEGENTHKSFGN